MPFTDNSDIYVAIHDAGINRFVKHVMRKRPSLFNYGTSFFLNNPQALCEQIDVAPEVTAAGNPIIKVMDPLPVPGMSAGLNFCIQLSKGEIDFHPGNVFTLPPELTPLANQHLAVHLRACAGIGCASRDFIHHLPGLTHISATATTIARHQQATDIRRRPTPPSSNRDINVFLPDRPQVALPPSKIECFCLDLFATAGCRITGVKGSQVIRPRVDGIEIVDLKPEGLENAIECYALLALNQGILPPIMQSASTLAFGVFNLPDSMGKIQVSASTAVPNNPAIENDQLKAFVNLDKVELNIVIQPGGGGSGGGGGGGGGTVTRTVRPRTRTGTFDLTAAISEKAFVKVFDAVVKGFRFKLNGSGSFGPFSVTYAVEAHLAGGTIDLRNNGSILISELDIKWDTLFLDIGFDIPKVCTPGFCLIPIPFDGCAVYIDPQCIFEADPDFHIPINLGGLLTSEVTVTAIPKVFYGVGSGVPNRWEIAMVPTLPIDLDIIDIADTAGDLFHNLIVNAIDGLISGLPQWAKDLIDWVLGGVEDIIRTVLDIPDDIGEWFLDMIGSLGIFQALIDALAQYIAITLFELEDPCTVLPADGPLIPVKVPIEFLGITVNTSEMVVEGDLGN
ncbi:MAG: hypothetical protein ABI347_10495 [Nitrososphaera sp.]